MKSDAALHSLLTRRSTSVKDLTFPGPNEQELEIILKAGTRTPDHGKLCPWRIKILTTEGKQRLGDLCSDLFKGNFPDSTDVELEFERVRFTRAPLVIAILYVAVESQKVPPWEQILSTGAVCMNILHACHALGYGAKWLTEWPAYYREVRDMLGGGEDDRVAGFIYIGSRTADTADRERPELSVVVSEF